MMNMIILMINKYIRIYLQ